MRHDSMAVGRAGGFGKVPALGDFVRVRSGVASMGALEGWVAEGMALADARREADWPTRYLRGSVHAFVYRAGCGRDAKLLAGILRPSRDAAGRLFPIVLGAELPREACGEVPALLPMLLGDFLEEADAVAGAAADATSQAQFESKASELTRPSFTAQPLVRRDFEHWCSTTPLAHAWSAVLGPSQVATAPELLMTLLECVSPLRGQEEPTTPLSLKLPLGIGGAASAAFWLHLIHSVARWRANVPTSFWCFDGTTGSLLVQLGTTPPRTIRELWNPDGNDDHVCDLTRAPTTVDRGERALRRLPPAVARVVAAPETAVDELVVALREGDSHASNRLR